MQKPYPAGLENTAILHFARKTAQYYNTANPNVLLCILLVIIIIIIIIIIIKPLFRHDKYISYAACGVV